MACSRDAFPTDLAALVPDATPTPTHPTQQCHYRNTPRQTQLPVTLSPQARLHVPQAGGGTVPGYQELRERAAGFMREHPDDFIPFIYDEVRGKRDRGTDERAIGGWFLLEVSRLVSSSCLISVIRISPLSHLHLLGCGR